MSKLSLEELASLDVLQAYISALDGKAMKAWLDTFDDDPDASYICTARNDVECGLKVAMMLDDCRDRLIDRCTFIEDIWAGTFQDYRTRHFAQRVTAERREDGTYEDIIRMDGGRCRFLSRTAVTDNSVLPRYLVFPL